MRALPSLHANVDAAWVARDVQHEDALSPSHGQGNANHSRTLFTPQVAFQGTCSLASAARAAADRKFKGPRRRAKTRLDPGLTLHAACDLEGSGLWAGAVRWNINDGIC